MVNPGIDATANGSKIDVVLMDADGGPLFSESGTVTANAASFDISGEGIALKTDLGEVTVIIGPTTNQDVTSE